ncbi:MAG TPA: hypothetical protein VIE68_04200 [Gemmatimonadota bacterium]
MRADGSTYSLSNDDRTIPRELESVEALELRIWNTGFERFEELARLPNLVVLEVMDYRSDSFAPLGGLLRLRRLHVTHFPRVDSLDPLSGLGALEDLTLETLPSWDASKKRQVVKSLRPLAALGKLRSLRLAGVYAEDGDLSPIGELTGLRELAIANLYSQEQFALLSAKLPDVRSSFLAPCLQLGISCGKCGGEKVMLSGADVPNPKVVCPVCQRRKFETTVERFLSLARRGA